MVDRAMRRASIALALAVVGLLGALIPKWCEGRMEGRMTHRPVVVVTMVLLAALVVGARTAESAAPAAGAQRVLLHVGGIV